MKIRQSTQTFDVIGLQAADLPHAGLAAAFARSGGLALLDLEFVVDADRAVRNFAQLCGNAGSRLGLRVTPGSAKLAKQLLSAAGERTLTVVLGGSDNYKKLRKDAGLRAGDLAWAEVSDPAQLAAAASCDGIVARGHEAGGWVGEYTSYILLQKLSGQTELPIVVQGGIGVHSTAACRIAGAAGVVLDDQMLLLAESPLPLSMQNEFARLNGSETRLFGELLDRTIRVYNRPGSAALKAAEEDNRQAEGGLLSLDDWQSKTAGMVSWAGGGDRLFPLGQGIGLAATFRKRYGNVAKLVQAIRRASRQQIDQAASLRFIDENGALAASHGTRFPLAQGPMTRVSDSPDFAVEVARGGALPFLALALMRGPQVREMLEQTRDRIGDRPWGVGMLGFIPHSLREEQCAEIWKCAPPFALIAGGRPDQAAEFENRGIKTYIHAPAPALLKMYLEQGARRFVFEGRECGGHIGPLASFTLWEEMIDVLLEHVKPGEEKDIHVLFAGGVHDALSGAMVAAMTAPLAGRGMKVGALMGTAYLFTDEIVSTGAIVGGFQDQALACARTKNLETGPGHATRCADTGFAAEFFDKRRELIRAGRSAEEIRDELEDLNLGRLRVASKGINRDAEGKIVEIDAKTQISDGMYMIGQVATLRDARVSIEKLHGDVCHGAQQMLAPAAVEPHTETPSNVAIVGIGVVLPKANSAEDYWNNLLNKVSVIREVPESRWDWKLFFDQNRKVRDKVYSRWGGFLEEIHFDPTRFGIPPKSMKSIDPMQLLALEGASRALDDAGYAKGGFDRETTSVILGASGGAGELGVQYGLRAELPRFVENISDEVWERLPEWTEESFAGVLPNVAAGRIANRLDFGGVNLTVDAACASSLAAISMAVTELESGRSSMVLAGGFDTTQSIYGFTTFAKTQALSPSGKPKTFDQGADGIAISEGTAIVVLKRLADAERDGDRIYAVIKAAAGSSDGKALGLTAPRSE
ncbi:MAG TPA: beta-ketoacyl synthase N-terminal-like domain-containing protein, partial [Solimonas sp.]